MFDIAFSEIVVIGVVALVVIGPERLPRVARTVGHLVGRAQRYVTQVRADIGREMQLEDLKKMHADISSAAQDFKQHIHSEFQQADRDLSAQVTQVRDISQSLRDDILGAPRNPPRELPPAPQPTGAPHDEAQASLFTDAQPPGHTPEDLEFQSRQLDLFAAPPPASPSTDPAPK